MGSFSPIWMTNKESNKASALSFAKRADAGYKRSKRTSMRLMECALLCLVVLLLPATVGFTEAAWKYRIDNEGFAILSAYRGSASLMDGDILTIPETVDGISVIGLDEGTIPEGIVSVELPATVTQIAEKAIPKGCIVTARHGTAALTQAEARGITTKNLSVADFSEIIVDLTGTDIQREEEGFSVSRALGIALKDAVAFYEPNSNEAWLIDGMKSEGERTLLLVHELDPMLTYNQIVIESRSHAAKSVWFDEQTGKAVFEFTPSDHRFTRSMPYMDFMIKSYADVKNLSFRMELNTVALMGPAMLAGYNLAAVMTGHADQMVDFSELVQSCQMNCDLGFEMETSAITDSSYSPNWSVVGELEMPLPGKIPLPLHFEICPSFMLQFVYLQANRLETGIEGIHFDFNYRYRKNAQPELSANFSSGTPFTRTTELDSNEMTLQFVLALDWLTFCTIGEFTYGITWNEQVARTEQEDYLGTSQCRDVSWEVYRRAQATFNPGIDFTKLNGQAGRAKAYVQRESDMGNGVTMGVTYGLVTSAYITKEFAKALIPWPFRIHDSVLQSGDSDVHFERDEFGYWKRKDVCERMHCITFVSGIEGDVPVTVDCSGIWSASMWNRLNRQIYREGKVFTGWLTPDGDDFFANLNRHINPFDWKGELVLTAGWKDAEQRDPPEDGPRYSYFRYEDGYHISGRGIGNPQATYDSLLSPPNFSLLVSAGILPNDYLAGTQGAQEMRDNFRAEVAGFGSCSLHVESGRESGPGLKNVVYGNRVVTSEGYAFSPGLESVFCHDGMKSIGSYRGCTALSSVTLPKGEKYTRIEEDTFRDCISLRSILLPEQLTEIGSRAFEGSGLRSIELPGGITVLEDNAFDSCASLGSVEFPETLTRIGRRALAGTKLRNVSIDCDTISASAFDGTVNLRSVTFTGDRLQIPEAGAFSGAMFTDSSLETLTIDVGYLAGFFNLYCQPTLKKLTIKAPNGIAGSIIITSCSRLEELIIECGSCPSLGVDDCQLLKNVTVRNSGVLGELYLNSCNSLEKAVIEGTVKMSSIENCASLTSVTLGSAQPEEGKRSTHFQGLPNIRRIDIPNGVTTLETGAVEYNESLCMVTIPADTKLEPDAIRTKDNQTIVVRRRTAGSFGTIGTEEGYTLSFTGPFGQEEDDCRVRAGTLVTLFTPGRSGLSGGYESRTFLGWYLNENREHLYIAGETFEMPERDSVLTAVYEYSFSEIGIENGKLIHYVPRHDPETAPLILPEEVTQLGEESIYWSERVVWLGAGIAEAEESAFRAATHLERIEVDPANQVYTSIDGVLYTKGGTLVCVPQGYASHELVVKSGTIEIGANAFYAFFESPLDAVYIPDTVIAVHENWYGALAESANVYGPEEGPVAESAGSANLYYNMFPVFFLNGKECVAVVIARSGTELGDLGLTDVEGFRYWSEAPGGASVSSTFRIPFGGCTLFAVGDRRFASMTLPNSLREIGERAFSGISTDSIAVPDSVSSIASNAFCACPNLRRVYLSHEVNEIIISDDAFEGCKNMITLVGPKGGAAEAYAIIHQEICTWEQE